MKTYWKIVTIIGSYVVLADSLARAARWIEMNCAKPVSAQEATEDEAEAARRRKMAVEI